MSQIKLSKMGDNSLEDLQAISNSVKKYVDTENDATLQMAIDRINSNPTFWQRLFPNKFTREHDKMTIEKMRSVFKAKENMFEIYTGVQLEIARQQGDALLAATGMQLRDQLAKFANEKFDSLSTTLEGSKTKYVDRIASQLDNAEKYQRHPELYEDYKKSIKFEWKQYFSFVEDLIVGFREALDNKVAQLNKR